MYEAKTKPTNVKPSSYIAAIESDERRKDCKTLVTMMSRITGCPAKMWGPSIVGFNTASYTYASGHSGECCLIGFSSGKAHLSLYLLGGYADPATNALLAKLGKHKTGKACLYIKRLSEVDLTVLESLIERSIVITRQRFAKQPA